VSRHLGRLSSSRVAGLRGPVALFLGERRLMNQQVRRIGSQPGARAGHRVSRKRELAPGPGWPHHLVRRDPADRLSVLNSAELRSRRQARADRGLRIKYAWALLLEKDVPQRGAAMSNGE